MFNLSRRRLIAAGAATAASLSAPHVFAQSRRPELKIAVQSLPVTLEPVNAIGNVGNRVSNAIFDTLIRRDFLHDGSGSATTLVPAIAAKWSRDDNRTVTVTLADNVRFHNGNVVTADDVAFTFSADRLWGEKPMVPRGPLFSADFDSVTALDAKTVRFRTKSADYSLEKRLASWISWVVPEKTYRDLGPDAFGLKPVGTGPYKLVEFVVGDHVTLEAFDDYYLGQPTASRITFQVVPEVATRAAGLISGDFDMVCALSPDNLAMLEGQSDVEARSAQIENVHLVVYQSNSPLLSDKRIRQALNLCIDRDLINKTLWGGLAGITNGFQIPQYGACYDAKRPGFKLDPVAARKLLDEAGYKGEHLVFRTLNDYYVNSVAAIQMMQQMWKSVGLNVDLDIVDNWGQALAPGLQMVNWSNGFQMPDAATPIASDWGPKGGGQTTYGWKAPAKFNELGAQIRSLPDGDERRAAFQQAISIWEDEAPAAVLYRPVEIYGVRKNIRWKPVTFEFMDLRPYNLAFA